MKNPLSKYPTFTAYLLAILLFGLALFIGGLLNKGLLKEYFPYIPVVLLLLATWLLYKREGLSLNRLGLNPSLKNLSFVPLGLLIGALAFLGSRIIRAAYLGEQISVADQLDFGALFLSLYYILPQVATEELLFRGYLFKKTISRTNVVAANVIFSILFMLIHVLDDQVLSQPGMLNLLAVTIPVGYLLFATALLQSRTLYFPIGLHLGNNWATRHLISGSNSGDSILYVSNAANFETWTPFIVMLLLTNGFFLLVCWCIWRWDKMVFYFKHMANTK